MRRDLVCLSPNGVDHFRTENPPTGLLVATMAGVVTLQKRDSGWQVTGEMLPGLHVSSLMREPERGALFAGIHDAGLYRSLDDGQSWELNDNGITQPHIFSLGYDQRPDKVTLFAGSEPAHLFRSTDCGNSWHEVVALRDVPGVEGWNFPPPPHLAHVKHVAVDPRDPRIFYVCVEQGALLKTIDDGQSFKLLHFEDDACRLNKDTHRIVFHPRNPDEILLDGGDGIFRSRDAGENWQRVAATDMRIAYPDHLYLPGDGSIVVTGGGTPPNVWRHSGDAASTIVRSLDGGHSWTQPGHGLPPSLAGNIEAMTMASWSGGYGFFAGTSDGELFVSLDKGENWELAAAGLPPVSKCVHHANLLRGREASARAG